MDRDPEMVRHALVEICTFSVYIVDYRLFNCMKVMILCQYIDTTRKAIECATTSPLTVFI